MYPEKPEAEVRGAVPHAFPRIQQADDGAGRRQPGLEIHLVVADRRYEDDLRIMLERKPQEAQAVLPFEAVRFVAIRTQCSLRDTPGKQHQETVLDERAAGVVHAPRRNESVAFRERPETWQALPARVAHEPRHAPVPPEKGGHEEERIHHVESVIADQDDAAAGAEQAEETVEVDHPVAVVAS